MYIANKNPSLTDGNRIKRLLLEFIIGVLFVIVAIYSIKTGQFIIGLVLALLPLAMKVLAAPNVLILLSVLCSLTRFLVPGIKAVGGLDASLLINLLFIAIYLVGSTIGSFEKNKLEASNKFLALFGCVVFITAAYRGFGIYALGSDMIGGMDYVTIWIAIIFLNLASGFTISRKQIHFLIIAGVIGPFLTFLAQFITLKSGGSLWILSSFFDFEVSRVATALDQVSAGRGMRYETLIDLGLMLIPLPFIFKPRSLFLRTLLMSLLPIALIALFSSGFRRMMIGAIFVMFGCSLFVAKRKVLVFLSFIALGIAGIALAYSLAPSLSWNIQRAIAILPGVDIEASALHSANSSNEWRMELYSYCFEDIPHYLLMGKGLLLTLEEKLYQVSLMTGGLGHTSSAYFNYMAHGYHNGVLELLLDTGLFGFIFYALFLISFFSSSIKRVLRLGVDSFEVKYVGCILIIAFWKTLEIMTVRSGFFLYFANFYAYVVLVVLILNSLEKDRDNSIDQNNLEDANV